ncbi:MAG: hypothetical protein EAZ44_10580 [Cytophagia bacterium]|nr:MAG: hypothetical protein EAZ44_10580 [Cytophagia bacterium]TAG40673.1 MAG: hypothetical protein EAZ31_08210 [Cytophagia bacterium]
MKNLFVICFILFLSSCSQRLIDFTTISSKNVTMRLNSEHRGERTKGTHYVTVIFGIPLGSPNLKEATDRALEKAGKDYDCLIDGVVYRKRK